MILTLGTGMGSALCLPMAGSAPDSNSATIPGRSTPTRTTSAAAASTSTARRRGTSLLQEAIDQTAATFNWDHLYLGGGNTKKIDFKLRQERQDRLQRNRPAGRRGAVERRGADSQKRIGLRGSFAAESLLPALERAKRRHRKKKTSPTAGLPNKSTMLKIELYGTGLSSRPRWHEPIDIATTGARGLR